MCKLYKNKLIRETHKRITYKKFSTKIKLKFLNVDCLKQEYSDQNKCTLWVT